MEKELKKIGLTDYEIKVYLTLLQYGSQKGSTLSKLSHVPQSKIYDSLYKLSHKNFVSILNVRPKLFKAVQPAIALRHYLATKKEELEKIEKDLPQQFQKMNVIQKSPLVTDELITVYRGKKDTHPLILYRYAHAKEYVKDMFTFEYIPDSIFREIRKAVQRGVKVHMLATKIEPTNRVIIRQLKKVGVIIKYYPVVELRLAIVDGVEAHQMIVNPRNPMDRISLVVESLELTKALEHYFDYVWKKAKYC